jgi:hypothetical protein
MPSHLTARVDRLYRRRGERCRHCGKFPSDPPSTSGETVASHDLDTRAFAAFMDAVEACRGTPTPDPDVP